MNTLPALISGRILLLVTPYSGMEPLLELVARVAVQNPIYVLDGGNTFQGYRLAQIIRRQTADYEAALSRVMLSRAFTCYQMAAVLAEGAFEPHPLLVLDFLATFYDQSVRAAERRRLLRVCITHLKRLSRKAPIAIWVRQRSAVPEEALEFLNILEAAAGQVWMPERLPAPSWQQSALWENPTQFPGAHSKRNG